jgi:IrrE N-terminal-like domain
VRFLASLILTLVVNHCGDSAAQQESDDTSVHMRREVATRNPLVFVRGTRGFRFLVSLFPEAGDRFDPETDYVMTSAQQENAGKYLSVLFEMQKWNLTKEMDSVLQALAESGIRPAPLTPAEPVKLTFVDDQRPWANTISPTEVQLGARMLRGLVLGSLSESTTGEDWASKRLGAFLGVDPKSAQSTQDLEIKALEVRTRLFFAAMEKGTLLVKGDTSFDNSLAVTQALTRRYLGANDGADAAYASLEKRLQAAAVGGTVSASDGQIMYDLFQDLSRHVEAAYMFVMSHELGHVVLGHAPFPPNLSCAEKKRREDDADTFAMALLVYDSAGEVEAGDLALSRMALKTLGKNRLNYGYAHAIRYGFGWAGSSNSIDPNCRYRDPDDRIAFVDHARENLVNRRSETVEKMYRLFSARPPYVYTRDEVDKLGLDERRHKARELFALCGVGSPPPVLEFTKVKEFPFGWVVPCPNELPLECSSLGFQDRLGRQTWKDVQEDYRRHIPFSSLLIGHPAVLPTP